ncbi:MAG: hypothetical protein M1826_002781 [Phylliscum demangeonii]|nr:MAG: hypothetical protein M1826_002781 [Phylliscum demangeonii]
MDMGPPDPTVVDLPLSDPRCNSQSCNAYAAATNVSQAAVPWAGLFEYGHWTTYFYVVVIFLFMFVYAYGLMVDWASPRATTRRTTPTLLDRLQASIRFVSYRRLSGRVANRLGLPSLGVSLMILAAIVFATVAAFAKRPYYRERDGYGSPPLAIRTGLMATALIPIIVALAGKFNIITLLTGVSHEKLNTMHRYLSWICLVLSITHTIPFIVAPLRDGGRKQLHDDFYMPDSFMYTGVPPWAVLTFLAAASVPWIRARFYELFAATHIMAAIVFLGLMFWHTGDTLDSWAYLWATLAIWLFSLLGRVFIKNRALSLTGRWFHGDPTNVRHLSEDIVALEVLVPDHYRWRPSQHFFLRFPSMAPFDNHPFTVASIPHSHSHPVRRGADDHGLSAAAREMTGDQNTLTFLIRSHAGFTARLLRHAQSNPDVSTTVLLDGPYGGVARRIERSYESVICVAGGVGVTASVAWVLHLARMMKTEPHRTVTRHVRMIWAVRRRQQLRWIADELLAAAQRDGNSSGGMSEAGGIPAAACSIVYEFYVTGERGPAELESERDGDDSLDHEREKPNDSGDVIENEKTTTTTTSTTTTATKHSLHYGRPHLATLIPRVLDAVDMPRTYVLGCGPESLKVDLSSAVAAAQTRVLAGRAREVALHTESFGW